MPELPEKLCRITGIGQTVPERPSAKRPIRLFLDAAREAIARVAAKPELSNDVREVVTRALAD